VIEPNIERGPTWEENWRHSCEMRVIEAMSHERRKTFLAGVAQKRGDAALEKIIRSLSPTALRELAEEK
jgi:hypothetical protein